jgi:hypothetical protein
VLVEPLVGRLMGPGSSEAARTPAGHIVSATADGGSDPLQRFADAVQPVAAGPGEYALIISVAGLLCAYALLTARRR